MINLKITIAEKLENYGLKDIDQNELNDKTNNLQNLYFSILIYELKKTL